MRTPNAAEVQFLTCLGFVLASTACEACATKVAENNCLSDQNGVSGGKQVIDLAVSDTAFTVGAFDAGPGEPNITLENGATVTFTLSNVGARPHDFAVQCLPTPNQNGCPTQSCFPTEAGVPALAPGGSVTIVFVAPVHEGTYRFISDVQGDTQTSPDGGVTGLVGQVVLL